jgi:hypothetical protein
MSYQHLLYTTDDRVLYATDDRVATAPPNRPGSFANRPGSFANSPGPFPNRPRSFANRPGRFPNRHGQAGPGHQPRSVTVSRTMPTAGPNQTTTVWHPTVMIGHYSEPA